MNTNGLYIGGQFVSFAEAKKSQPNIAQIASRSTVSGFQSLGSVLPNPDPVLKKMGKDIQAYKDLKTEAGVKGCLRRRKAAVKAKAWRIVKDEASEQVFDRINAIFKKLPMNKIIGGMADGAYFGYQPMEVMWAYTDGAWLPVNILAMPADWYFFDQDNNLRFKDKHAGQDGLLLDSRKYLVPTQDATYDNPYGEPDAASIFWPTTFKLGGFEWFTRFTEKYGSPWVIGKYGNNYDEAKQETLLNNLYAMVQDAVAVIPDNSSIEIVEAGGKGASADVYEKFLMFCRSEVNIALLGQNQSTEADATRASATSGAQVAAEISDGDCEMVAEQLQLLIDWIVDYNWGGSSPQFEFFEDSNGGSEQAERDVKLANTGARFSEQYYMREYGLQQGDLLPASSQAASLEFAEKTYQAVAESAPERLLPDVEESANQSLDQIIQRLRKVVMASKTLPRLQEDILHEFSDLDADELVKVMQLAMTLAELEGRSEVLNA